VPSPAYEPAHCIVCGHANSAVVAEHDDIRREVEDLWEYHERRLCAGTPSRFLYDRVAFSQHPPFRLVRCVDCGLVYRNPAERADDLIVTYESDDTHADVLLALHQNQLATAHAQARTVRRTLGRGGSGLEVGSYVGGFLAAARDVGLNVEGLDVNRHVADFARSLGFTVHDGTLAELRTDRVFDLVAIWNTFDQLADPRAAVYDSHRLLRTHGILAIRVPNGAFYSAAQRQLSGGRARRAIARETLAQNNLLAFPYRWGFTIESLSRLLDEAGFALREVRGDSLVRTGDRYTRRWARAEERLVKSAVGVFSRLSPSRAPWIEVLAQKR
jgi:SAM-dependent methyltransferase